MTRPAQACAGWATMLIVAAVLLAGCGSHAVRHADRAKLCVDAGLPLTGSDGAAGRGILTGLEMRINRAGATIGGDYVRLCDVVNTAAATGALSQQKLLAATVSAANDSSTIAYVGALTSTQASEADAVLGQAGIPLITPSAPAPTSTASDASTPTAAGAVPLHHTTLSLLPATGTQTAAVQAARSAQTCKPARRRHPASCVVLTQPPLCSGIAAVPRTSKTTRYCVVAGTADLSSWASPAVAYGYSAGQVLVSALDFTARAGRSVADRSVVMAALRRTGLTAPIGPVRFDSQGAIEADTFGLYTVESGGGLVLSHTFRTH